MKTSAPAASSPTPARRLLPTLALCVFAAFRTDLGASDPILLPNIPSLHLPKPDAHRLRMLSPNLLELTLITSRPANASRPPRWDFINSSGDFQPPAAGLLQVTVDGSTTAVERAGFKRRPLFAPLRERDLRIANHLYLRLSESIPEHQSVEVLNPGHELWPAAWKFAASNAPLRYSPAIHVNQVGYLPDTPKRAMIGYYLGSLGEMILPGPRDFSLVETASGETVHSGTLVRRPDQGFPFPCYQEVWEADFSGFNRPGEYRLAVPGLGASFPFRIHEGVAAAYARAYALGLYHQRCGTPNALPFTRFTHGPCHTDPAQIPIHPPQATWKFIDQASAAAADNPRHTAPRMTGPGSMLFPFVRQDPVDVSGGHHDAGDYSKYTVNSAALIHHLIFAADVFPGVADLDNLGLPESGNGVGDMLQEAKWEADFLAKMQDEDGGFYFLVYPRDRKYESHVLPDQGDPQVVWPKNTAATAAAVAALAQCSSSPHFRRAFPGAADRYRQQALKGWEFLLRAIDRHGSDGAYQRLTHYGDDFLHDDELAWAACELFLATGDSDFHERLRDLLDPGDPGIRKWGWWRMYEGYGRAIRGYAFAARSGRIAPGRLDSVFRARCEAEIVACAEDRLRDAWRSAYGTSFPEATKRVRTAGWYFSSDQAFDLAVAFQLDHPPLNDPRPDYLDAILGNLNYEAGCNPVNVSFITGLGRLRQREIVHQFAQNDRRALPPSGLPIGNLQGGFGWIDHYKKELGALCFPLDGDADEPYPLYDRWGDSFNLATEFVIANQARALATAAFLMARTSLKDQAWKPVQARITGLPKDSPLPGDTPVTVRARVEGLNLDHARLVWEARDQEPFSGHEYSYEPGEPGAHWIEVEIQLPDGRRVFGSETFHVARP